MATALPIMSTGGGLNIAQLIQAITPLLGGTGTTNQTTGTTSSQQQGQTGQLSIDPAINQLLTQLFGQVTAGNTGFTKEAAIADSQNALQNLARMAVEQNMPSVLGGGAAAGLYNDTTRNLLSNDLQSRIAAQGAQLIQDNINRYAQITQQGNQTAAQIGSTLAQGNRTQTQNNTQTTTQQQQQQQQTSPVIGGSAKNNALTGLGITAGGTLLKNWDDLAKMFGGIGGGSNVAFDVGSIVNPGNMLNAGYGIDTGIGGLAPSFGSAVDFGTGITDVATNAGYNFAGLGNDLTGLFTDAGASGAEGLSGLFTGSDISTPTGVLGGIGSALSGGFDWLTDAFSGIGDFFGGFFANGGQVPALNEIANKNARAKGNFANGGLVDKKQFANGGETSKAKGRAGRAAYTDSAMQSRIFDISRALWEEIQRGAPPPTLGQDTQVVAPGVNEGAGMNLTPISTNAGRFGDPRLDELINNIRNQVAAKAEAAAPSDTQEAASLASKARSANKMGENILGADAAAAAPATLLAAADLGGASSVLAGSPIQQALAASLDTAAAAPATAGLGATGDAASLAAGAGGGAAATGATLGTVDTLGSILGTGSFLPTYGAASSAAGTGASGVFGSGAGSTAGAGAGGAATGATGALATTGVGAVAALLASGFMEMFADWMNPDPGLKNIEVNWARAAMDPQSTLLESSILNPTGNAQKNFFKKFYQDVDWADPTSINQAFTAAQAAISSPEFGRGFDPEGTNVGGFIAAGSSPFGGNTQAQFDQAAGLAQYINQQIANNPQVYQEAFAPIVYPGQDPTTGAPTPTATPDGTPLNTPESTGRDVSWEFQIRPDTGQFMGGDLAWLDYQRATGQGGTIMANGGQVGRGGEIPDQSHDPEGKADDILIHVSGGEYVIPKSVVDAVGPEFFDNLVSKFHTQFPDRPPTK